MTSKPSFEFASQLRACPGAEFARMSSLFADLGWLADLASEASKTAGAAAKAGEKYRTLPVPALFSQTSEGVGKALGQLAEASKSFATTTDQGLRKDLNDYLATTVKEVNKMVTTYNSAQQKYSKAIQHFQKQNRGITQRQLDQVITSIQLGAAETAAAVAEAEAEGARERGPEGDEQEEPRAGTEPATPLPASAPADIASSAAYAKLAKAKAVYTQTRDSTLERLEPIDWNTSLRFRMSLLGFSRALRTYCNRMAEVAASLEEIASSFDPETNIRSFLGGCAADVQRTQAERQAAFEAEERAMASKPEAKAEAQAPVPAPVQAPAPAPAQPEAKAPEAPEATKAPADEPASEPVNPPADAAAAPAAETPAEEPVQEQEPAQKPADEPADVPAEPPAELSAEPPAEEPAEESADAAEAAPEEAPTEAAEAAEAAATAETGEAGEAAEAAETAEASAGAPAE